MKRDAPTYASEWLKLKRQNSEDCQGSRAPGILIQLLVGMETSLTNLESSLTLFKHTVLVT